VLTHLFGGTRNCIRAVCGVRRGDDVAKEAVEHMVEVVKEPRDHVMKPVLLRFFISIYDCNYISAFSFGIPDNIPRCINEILVFCLCAA
jgi:hypothetical protein